jgi:hypothetical protein
MRCTRKRQGKAERNSPERSECTSGLAARRTQLCQGAVSAEARMADEGPLQLHPDGEAEGQIGITGRDPIWQETLPRPCDATAHWACSAAFTRNRAGCMANRSVRERPSWIASLRHVAAGSMAGWD